LNKGDKMLKIKDLALVIDSKSLENKEITQNVKSLNERVRAIERALKRAGILIY